MWVGKYVLCNFVLGVKVNGLRSSKQEFFFFYVKHLYSCKTTISVFLYLNLCMCFTNLEGVLWIISFIPFWIRLHPLTSLKISCSPLLEGGKVTLHPSGCKLTLRPSGCKVTLRPLGCKVTFQYNTNNYIYYKMYIKIV